MNWISNKKEKNINSNYGVLYSKNSNARRVECVDMDDNKVNITQKLTKLVKQRKTPQIVIKQGSDRGIKRKTNRSFGSESYYYSNDE